MTETPLHVLFVGHEATRTGAPVGFLSLMRWFKEHDIADPVLWLRHGGPLSEAHAAIGPLAVGASGVWKPAADRPVHLAYLNTATLGSYAEVLAAKGIPVICHVHEMEYGLRVTGERNLGQLRQHVTRFIACSQAVKAALIRVLGIDESKIHVVPECVDVERALRLSAEPLPDAEPVPSSKTIVGMGTVNWRKGTDLFLRVLAHLNQGGQEWRGVWIGDLESSPDHDELLHDIRVLGLADRIRFTGSLANPFPHLVKADVYCLTSREDPYPLAMVEAAALGLPIVGFRGSGGVEEFAPEAGGITVDYTDTAAMAAAVRACCESPAQHGREAAERLCAPDVVGATIAVLMRETAAAQPTVLDAAAVAQLQKASLPALQAHVRLLKAETGHPEIKSCECDMSSAGKVQLVESWPQDPVKGSLLPAFVIAIEPRERSAMLQNFLVTLRKKTEPHSTPVRIKIRTTGRALICSDATPKAWLCLDGKGRLLVEIRLPEELAVSDAIEVTATWEQSLQIKEALSPLLKLERNQGPFMRVWKILTGKA